MMRTVFDTVTESGKKIEDYLLKKYKVRAIKGLFFSGHVFLNGERVYKNQIIREGDLIRMEFVDNLETELTKTDLGVKVLYSDEDVVIVFKPQGVASVPTRAHSDDSVLNNLALLYPDEHFHPVTRLDRGTSGLMVLARNQFSAALLCQDMTKIRKVYLAVLKGRVNEKLFISKQIEKNVGIERKISDSGKDARTYIYPETTVGEDTLCIITIENGRTHQIRIHAASEAFPVVGDTVYGPYKGEYNNGQLLECVLVDMSSPITNERIHINLLDILPENSLILKKNGCNGECLSKKLEKWV